jgi:mannose-6-phosphate isomerase-like protein (cupin superfamily)
MSIKIPKIPMFGKQIKIWGWTTTIALNSTMHIALAYLKSGGYSSKHYHKTLDNRFVVISGRLRVYIWRDNVEEFVDLQDGDVLDVEAGVLHRMMALEDTYINEIYWSNEEHLNAEDIFRLDKGGINLKHNNTVVLPDIYKFYYNTDLPYKPPILNSQSVHTGTCDI